LTKDQAREELAKLQASMADMMDQLQEGDMTEPLSPTLVNMNLLMLAGAIGKLTVIISNTLE
jgi:hypothetical protein